LLLLLLLLCYQSRAHAETNSLSAFAEDGAVS